LSQIASAAILHVVTRPTSMMATLILGLLALSMSPSCSGAGYGQHLKKRPSVVVLEVSGPGAKQLRNTIVGLLQDADYQLVPRKRYNDTARRLKARRLRASHVAKVATELDVDAVILGRVKRRHLFVTILDGSSGKRLDRFRIRLTRKRRLTKKGTGTLEQELVASLSSFEPQPAPEPEEPAADAEDTEIAEADEKAEKKAEEKREREAERAEKEKAKDDEKRAAAARKKAAKEKKERDEEPEPVELPAVGDDGQAIDDEMPAALR
jgi:hypothetical protein